MKTFKELEARKKALFVMFLACIITIMAYSLLYLAFPNVPRPIDAPINHGDP